MAFSFVEIVTDVFYFRRLSKKPLICSKSTLIREYNKVCFFIKVNALTVYVFYHGSVTVYW